MSDTIFTPATPGTEDTTASTVTNPAPTQSTLPPEVLALVGDGKKYATVADLAKGYTNADAFIEKLKADNAALKAQAEKAIATEDILEEIRKQGLTKQEEVKPTTPAATEPQVTPVDIDKRVEQVLAKREMLNRQEQNRSTVISAFEQTYGKEGEAFYLKVAEENQMTVGQLNQLAVTSPEVVLKLAGIKKTASTPAKPTGTVNTSGDLGVKPEDLSAKVKMVGASTKDVTQAWRNAGLKVQQKLKS